MDRGGAVRTAWKEQGEKGKGRLGWVMQGHPLSPLLAGLSAGFKKRKKRGTREVGGVRTSCGG